MMLPRPHPGRRRTYFTPLALAAVLCLAAPAAHAQCSSAANLVKETWEQYEMEAKEAGCMAPTANPMKWVACAVDAPGRGLKILDRMIGWWNNMAQGEWATIGPRQLGVGWEEGRLERKIHEPTDQRSREAKPFGRVSFVCGALA